MPPLSIALLIFGGGLLLSHPKDFPPPNDYYAQDELGKRLGLYVTYFGTTTILISDEKNFILIDGFFSRPSWSELILEKISMNPDRIHKMLSCCAPKVDAIFVSHSHHDHAMDVGYVAEETGATVIGSGSVGLIANASSNSKINFIETKDRKTYTFGRFSITPIETPHSDPQSYLGKVNAAFSYPASISEFRPDINYSFLVEHPSLRILIVPSANYRPGGFKGLDADVSMISIAGISTQDISFFEGYWKETVQDRGARLVIPIHWDDFTKPISPAPSALPYIADFTITSHGRLKKLARTHGVEFKYLRPLYRQALP